MKKGKLMRIAILTAVAVTAGAIVISNCRREVEEDFIEE